MWQYIPCASSNPCPAPPPFRLLAPDSPVLTSLGSHLPFECAVGLNGRVWLNSASDAHTVLLSNAVLNAQFLAPKQVSPTYLCTQFRHALMFLHFVEHRGFVTLLLCHCRICPIAAVSQHTPLR